MIADQRKLKCWCTNIERQCERKYTFRRYYSVDCRLEQKKSTNLYPYAKDKTFFVIGREYNFPMKN